MSGRASSIEQLLDQIDEVRENESSISLDEVLDAIGRRSFGPLLIVAGLIVLAPILGDIPGMATVMGIFVALVAGQIVFGRDHIWLPQWMLDRSIKTAKLDKPLRWLRKPARWADGLTQTRLRALTSGVAVRVVAGVCLLLAFIMPLMEVVPFSANAGGLVLMLFGLALIAGDGLMALIGSVFTVVTVGLIAWSLLS